MKCFPNLNMNSSKQQKVIEVQIGDWLYAGWLNRDPEKNWFEVHLKYDTRSGECRSDSGYLQWHQHFDTGEVHAGYNYFVYDLGKRPVARVFCASCYTV